MAKFIQVEDKGGELHWINVSNITEIEQKNSDEFEIHMVDDDEVTIDKNDGDNTAVLNNNFDHILVP